MKRVAVIGGGIAGLSAAYELVQQQRAGAPLDFVLFEASPRLGGIVETVRRDGFVIECGPDSWVTEKPWARELAVELGLESDLIYSRDEQRRTYLAEHSREQGTLRPLPEGLRMGIPVEWASVLESPLLSPQAKRAYQQEPKRADELKALALDRPDATFRDESVRDFFVRHFGSEVTGTIVAPLMAGVYGGDISQLSARAAFPSLIRLDREHGSLVLGLEREKSDRKPLPIFTTLRGGLAVLVESMESRIPAEKIRRGYSVTSLERTGHRWRIHAQSSGNSAPVPTEAFDAVLVATPAATTTSLLKPLDPRAAELLPHESSSAIVVALAYSAAEANSLNIPDGFGFLVSQGTDSPSRAEESISDRNTLARQSLLACTFVDQKFTNRVPPGGRLLRAFFAGSLAPSLLPESDDTLQALARSALETFLGKLPDPSFSIVRRWPQSLPLYTVGHTERMAELDRHVARLPYLRLIGNAYHGVGLPDLIRDSRNAARDIAALSSAAQ